jgi:hypothetical protein
MPSATQITWRKRDRRRRKLGKPNKKLRAKNGTPKFPIHPEQEQAKA